MERGKELLLMGILIIATAASCRKPRACVQPSTTFANLGQEISFMDCSESAYNYRYDFGDGTPRVEQQAPVHSYTAPGVYTIKVEVSTKNDRRETEATSTVNVRGITEGDFTNGKWILYKIADSDDLGLYNEINVQTPGHEYQFTSDSVFIYDGFSNPFSQTFHLVGDNQIRIDSKKYDVVRCHENEIWYRTIGFGFYTQYYLKKI